MKRSLVAAIAAFSSRFSVSRALSVVIHAKSSRITGDATTVSVRLPGVAKVVACDHKTLPSAAPRLSPRARTDGEILARKVCVSLRFDTALIARVDEAAKLQGITRTSWLHRAAFDALGGLRGGS
jgi:hypothetical protein